MNGFSWDYGVFATVLIILTAVLGTARLARLGAEDLWPPILWLRHKWVARFNASEWAELAVCPFCQAPYIAVVTIGWGLLSDFHWSWWLFYGWLSISYLAAMVVARDIPQS